MSCSARSLLPVLLHKGIKVHLENKRGVTPLHFFCQKFSVEGGDPKEMYVFQEYCLFQVSTFLSSLLIMIEKGAALNVQDESGETPLHRAILNQALGFKLMKFLIAKGASVNIPRKNGETPLHFAVRMQKEDIVNYLVRHKAGKSLFLSTYKKHVLT